MGIGLGEGLLIVGGIVVVAVFFGWKKLPDASKSLSSSIISFKKDMKKAKDEMNAETTEEKAE